MRTTRCSSALIVLWASLIAAGAYSQAPPPEQPAQPVPPATVAEPSDPTAPQSSPAADPAAETPTKLSEPPLQFTPPPPPPPPPAEKPKVQIDSRGRRVRPKSDGKRARSGKPAVKNLKVPGTSSADDSEFKIRSDVELVLLDVSVKDQRGGFVSGLAKDDFKVFDNKVEQEITVFQAQDVPVTVGLVVDNSGSVRPKKDQIVTAALTFVKNSNPKDEVFIINFNDRILKGLPNGVDFTDDHAVLREGLLLNPAQGRTALYDGLNEALDHIEKGRLDKKTIVLIADGGDNMSEITEGEIVHRVEGSFATIKTVGILKPHLAEISGGEYYRPQNISHLVGVCEKIAHDIRNRYTIGYSPKDISFDGKVRKLRVTAKNPVDGRELEIRTRSQYQTPVAEARVR
jgi:Ca-activated chloride channel homolog